MSELAKVQYLWMPLRFKKLVSLENPLLPYYTELFNFDDKHALPVRHHSTWVRLNQSSKQCSDCGKVLPEPQE